MSVFIFVYLAVNSPQYFLLQPSTCAFKQTYTGLIFICCQSIGRTLRTEDVLPQEIMHFFIIH